MYFHEKGLFQRGVNASQMPHFHATSNKNTQLTTALFCLITRPVVGPEDGTNRVSRKFGKKLPLLAALTSQKSAILSYVAAET